MAAAAAPAPTPLRPLAVSSREGSGKILAAILFWPKMCALFIICVFITYNDATITT